MEETLVLCIQVTPIHIFYVLVNDESECKIPHVQHDPGSCDSSRCVKFYFYLSTRLTIKVKDCSFLPFMRMRENFTAAGK